MARSSTTDGRRGACGVSPSCSRSQRPGTARPTRRSAGSPLSCGACDCECDCPAKHVPCATCEYLDGRGAAGRIVSELRTMGGVASNAALQVELGITHTGVIKAVAALVRSGRVRKVTDDISDEGSKAVVLYELRGAP